MDNQLIEKLYDTIDDTVNTAVDKAGYNRTIQATIVKCIDSSIGKYQCKYQDSSFYAYSEDINTTYTDGSSVYILVQNNDLSGNKQIIGSVKKLGLNYISETEEENFYDINGNSCINDKGKIFGLKSYKKEDILILYDKTKENNKIEVNKESASEYLKNSTSLMIEATIQTKLDKIQQFRGNYGIRFILDFENNSDGSSTTKEFCLDVDQLTGNPYKLVNPTRQYAIFEIDYGQFQSINKIELYSKDFPNNDNTKSEDIFFSNIQIFGANKMSQSEINGCSISFIFPQGTFYDANNKNVEKQIKAQVKLKGKVVDPTLQNVEFYWYREDIRTTLNSEYYNSWGGRGWRCLNQKTITQPETDTEQAVVEWIPMGDTFVITYADAIASENTFKCVVKYDSRVFSKTFVIKNKNGVFDSRIEASPGNEFYYDVGSPTLTCVTSNPDNIDDTAGLQYSWAMVDSEGLMTFLSETTDINDELKTKKEELETIEQEIEDGKAFQNASQDKINTLKEDIEYLESLQRVDGKHLYSIDLTKINQQATFKCSIYDTNDIYLGTCSTIIQNLKDQTQKARLIINNGSQVFKYDENGIAPTNTSLENPISLKVLSYTIFDENGDEVDFSVASKCSSKWRVPISRTMLRELDSDGQTGAPDSKQEYQYYNDATILSYKIAEKFDYNKDLNNIDLTVDYKGVQLYASTNFTFIKQGDIGTNGTDYVCRIELNTNDSTVKLPIVSINKGNTLNTASGKLNFTPVGENNVISNTIKKKLFKANLYGNGEKIEIPETSISWKILQNKYASTAIDESYYDIDSNGLISINAANLKNVTYPANLIQCQISYNGMNFYDVMPILTCFNLETDYTVDLKENSGFKYALYSSDGRNPKYNDYDPFEIIVNKKINNIYENISLIEGDNVVSFDWSVGGQVKRKTGNAWGDSLLSDFDLLKLKEKKTYAGDPVEKNQRYAIPPSEYDGECLTHCILVDVKDKNDDIVGTLHLPIYLLLNRYGIAAINQWDGNSVQINEEGGYILAPQIGAGIKDDNNRFTGVLMGEVREANRSTSDIGLLGYSEGEKTFFIDAEDGTTILGKKSSGRMTIDPSSDKALIYSDNFWENYTEKGKPTNYNTANEKGEGMLIDLTKPEIKFGKKTSKGNYAFRVDENGAITSTSGQIGGFTIDDNTIRSNNKTSATSGNGIYLNSLDSSLGLGTNFSVDSTGKLTAKSGKIAAFNFNDKIMYSDGKSSASSTSGGIYIDTDSSGNNTDIKFRLGGNFYVTKDGTLTAKSGTLGSFTLTTNALYSNNKKEWKNNNDGIFISNSGQLKIGGQTNGVNKFSVSSDGTLTCAGGTIGGWKISNSSISAGNTVLSSTGEVNFNDKFTVNNAGAITAKSGTIGGWAIGASTLTSTGYSNNTGIKLNNNGSINDENHNWYITSSGYAKFKNFNGSGTFSGSGTIAGSGGGYGVGASGLYGNLGTTHGVNQDIKNEIHSLDIASALSAKQISCGSLSTTGNVWVGNRLNINGTYYQKYTLKYKNHDGNNSIAYVLAA